MIHLTGLGLNQAQVVFLNLSAALPNVGTEVSIGGGNNLDPLQPLARTMGFAAGDFKIHSGAAPALAQPGWLHSTTARFFVPGLNAFPFLASLQCPECPEIQTIPSPLEIVTRSHVGVYSATGQNDSTEPTVLSLISARLLAEAPADSTVTAQPKRIKAFDAETGEAVEIDLEDAELIKLLRMPCKKLRDPSQTVQMKPLSYGKLKTQLNKAQKNVDEMYLEELIQLEPVYFLSPKLKAKMMLDNGIQDPIRWNTVNNNLSRGLSWSLVFRLSCYIREYTAGKLRMGLRFEIPDDLRVSQPV